MLEKGADPNGQAGKYGSALDAAIHRADRSIVELLLDHGAEVNVDDKEYGDMLRTAVSQCSKEVAIILVDPATNPTVDTQCYDKALQLEVLGGERQNVMLVNSSLLSPTIISLRLHATLKLQENLPQFPRVLNDGRRVEYSKFFTPLHLAAWSGHAEQVHLLLDTDPESGSVLKSRDQGPISPERLFGTENALGADVKEDFVHGYWSPLHIAIFRQHLGVIETIVHSPLKKLGG